MKNNSNRKLKLAGLMTAPLLALSLAGMPSAAFAAGGGDGGGSSSGGSSSSSGGKSLFKIKCKKGKVYDKKKKRCLTAKKSSSLDQDSVFEYGRSLAYAGEFNEAITVLSAAPKENDHRVLNMLGYSHRKIGKIDQAFAYYNASITLNPDYSLVREYLGEAYLQIGDLQQARVQLSEIERICGSRSCGEYGQLADMIVESQI